MVALNSSNIGAATYDDERMVMTLTFTNGGSYEYDCRRDIYDALIASPSPGSFFHRNVKDVYRATKVS